MRVPWNNRRVVDLLPPGTSEKQREWAEAFGTDIRRAWNECSNPLVLRILAYGIGVPGTVIREAWEREFGPPGQPLANTPSWEVWKSALNSPAARARIEASLGSPDPARNAAWAVRGLRAYREAIRLEDHLIFDDET